MSQHFNKIVPCSKTRLSEVRGFVRDIVDQLPIKPELGNLLVLAVDEVCANLIIHSNACDPSEKFELHVILEPQQAITFELVDKGIGFNIAHYTEPNLDDIVKRKRKGGLGLMLVHRIMDQVEFAQQDGKSVFRLTKVLAPQGV